MLDTRVRIPAIAIAIAAVVFGGCGDDSSPGAGDRRPAAKDPCPPWKLDTSTTDLFRGGSARVCTVSPGRRYLLFEPRDLGSEPTAVVIGLHGVGGGAANPQTMAEASRLDRVAARERFVAVYAEGEGGAWDERGDIAYFEQVLDHLSRRRPIDPARVHAIGWSAGSFMVHRLACELSDRFTAVAALHATLRGRCKPSRPVSVLQIVGTDDGVLPVGGGTTALGDRMPSVAGGIARWRRLDGCGAIERERGGPVRREVASSCDGDAAVELVTIRGGTHVWFGPGTSPPDDAVNATEEAWRFFTAQPRSG